MQKSIYLDYNATTALHPDIKTKMEVDLPQIPLNPSSVHQYGQKAKEILENCRSSILKLIFPKNYHDYDLIFTSSGTESNNIAISSFIDRHIVYSSLEHPSVYKICEHFNGKQIKFHNDDLIDFEDFEQIIAKNQSFVSIVYANSEMGGVHDLAKIAKISRKYGVVLHTDASQAFGKMHCNFDEILPDLITISSHKIYGPIGVAALIYNKKLQLKSIFYGGSQEFNLRASTENLYGIYGFYLACKMSINDFPNKYDEIAILRNKIDDTAIKNGFYVLGLNNARLYNTCMTCIPNSNTSIELAKLDIAGFMASGGTACSYGVHETSKMPRVFDLPTKFHNCSIRFSLGLHTKPWEIDELCNCINYRVNF